MTEWKRTILPALAAAALAFGATAAPAQERTPLHEAAEAGQLSSVGRLLLEGGADPNAVDEDGNTPLHMAAAAGYERHEAVVGLLLEAGADPNAKESLFGFTPLHWAAGLLFSEALVGLLLEAGANPNAKDNQGETPLHDAVRMPEVSNAVVGRLLEGGADPNAKEDRVGSTPLHWAAMLGHEVFARRLLAAGADPNAADIYGGTPLHWAAGHGHSSGRASVVRLLLEAGADPHAKDNEGETPLIAAITNDRDAVARLLLEAGARMPGRQSVSGVRRRRPAGSRLVEQGPSGTGPRRAFRRTLFGQYSNPDFPTA